MKGVEGTCHYLTNETDSAKSPWWPVDVRPSIKDVPQNSRGAAVWLSLHDGLTMLW